MKQLKDYFNEYLEHMKTYKSRADWYNKCKSDTRFYYDEMEKYATSDAYLKAVRLHKRIEKVEKMPETTNKEMVDNITEELCRIDKENETYYRKNLHDDSEFDPKDFSKFSIASIFSLNSFIFFSIS